MWRVLGLVACQVCLPARASSAAVKADGVVRLFVEKEHGRETQPEAEVQLKLKTKRAMETRAVVKLEGRYFRSDIYIKDAYIDHRLQRGARLRLGIDKKALGLEYEIPSRERLTLHRSRVYQRLQDLGIVGRQLQLRLRLAPAHGQGLYADAALGVDGSRNQNLLGSLRYRQGTLGFGAWALIERHRIEHTYLPVWAVVSSLWLDLPGFRTATELFAGVDAFGSEFQRQFGDGRNVVFYGPRAELAIKLPLWRRWQLEPFAQGALLAYDALQPARGHRSQLLLGLNLRRGLLVLRSNAELLTEHGFAPKTTSTNLEQRVSYHASAAFSF